MDVPAPFLILVAIAVIGLIGLVLRWGMASDADRRKDYGLLREVAKVRSVEAARFVELELQKAGVRATTVPSEDGETYQVLVFPADEQLAIQTLLNT
ncbi:hypothetical protein [Actinokineospora xionganensis]|uniref:SPOR domain-containing protein n=1 Tax=Actinokineospora xionganensis TaxID=2684470 RepID=A0ABR7L8Y8_9PSEU|nr:hypothetical protein [Actinokineospora xionganensis]MBC6449013.1 hypothetical protein [Actinokineospora xionganensis]